MSIATPTIPDGMIDLMKNLAKNVLRENPDNIYEFAANYFENLLLERDGSLYKGYEKFRLYSEGINFTKTDKIDKKKDENVSDVESSGEKIIPSNVSQITESPLINDIDVTEDNDNNNDDKNIIINENVEFPSVDDTSISDVNSESLDNVKKPKIKPRKLSSKKPSESLIAIKEETSTEIIDGDKINQSSSLPINDLKKQQNNAAIKIQTAFRNFMAKQQHTVNDKLNSIETQSQSKTDNLLSNNMAASIIQRAFKSFVIQKRNSDNSVNNKKSEIEVNRVDEINENDSGIDEIIEHKQNNNYLASAPHYHELSNDFESLKKGSEQINNESIDLDRLNTPNDSESGISEKSFNLHINENAEILVNQQNKIDDNVSRSTLNDDDIDEDVHIYGDNKRKSFEILEATKDTKEIVNIENSAKEILSDELNKVLEKEKLQNNIEQFSENSLNKIDETNEQLKESAENVISTIEQIENDNFVSEDEENTESSIITVIGDQNIDNVDDNSNELNSAKLKINKEISHHDVSEISKEETENNPLIIDQSEINNNNIAKEQEIKSNDNENIDESKSHEVDGTLKDNDIISDGDGTQKNSSISAKDNPVEYFEDIGLKYVGDLNLTKSIDVADNNADNDKDFNENRPVGKDIIVNDNDDKLEKSAIQIQKVYRGYAVRKNLNNEKNANASDNKELEENTCNNEEIKEQVAATIIQKNYRGYKVRKELVENKIKESNKKDKKMLNDDDTIAESNVDSMSIDKQSLDSIEIDNNNVNADKDDISLDSIEPILLDNVKQNAIATELKSNEISAVINENIINSEINKDLNNEISNLTKNLSNSGDESLNENLIESEVSKPENDETDDLKTALKQSESVNSSDKNLMESDEDRLNNKEKEVNSEDNKESIPSQIKNELINNTNHSSNEFPSETLITVNENLIETGETTKLTNNESEGAINIPPSTKESSETDKLNKETVKSENINLLNESLIESDEHKLLNNDKEKESKDFVQSQIEKPLNNDTNNSSAELMSDPANTLNQTLIEIAAKGIQINNEYAIVNNKTTSETNIDSGGSQHELINVNNEAVKLETLTVSNENLIEPKLNELLNKNNEEESKIPPSLNITTEEHEDSRQSQSEKLLTNVTNEANGNMAKFDGATPPNDNLIESTNELNKEMNEINLDPMKNLLSTPVNETLIEPEKFKVQMETSTSVHSDLAEPFADLNNDKDEKATERIIIETPIAVVDQEDLKNEEINAIDKKLINSDKIDNDLDNKKNDLTTELYANETSVIVTDKLIDSSKEELNLIQSVDVPKEFITKETTNVLDEKRSADENANIKTEILTEPEKELNKKADDITTTDQMASASPIAKIANETLPEITTAGLITNEIPSLNNEKIIEPELSQQNLKNDKNETHGDDVTKSETLIESIETVNTQKEYPTKGFATDDYHSALSNDNAKEQTSTINENPIESQDNLTETMDTEIIELGTEFSSPPIDNLNKELNNDKTEITKQLTTTSTPNTATEEKLIESTLASHKVEGENEKIMTVETPTIEIAKLSESEENVKDVQNDETEDFLITKTTNAFNENTIDARREDKAKLNDEKDTDIDQRKTTDVATTVNEQLVEAKKIQNDEIETIKDSILSVIPSVNNENKIESQEEIDQRKTTDLETTVNEQLIEAKEIQNDEIEIIKDPISSVIPSVNNENKIESQEEIDQRKTTDLATTVNEQLVEAKAIQNDEIETIKDPILSVIPSVNNENKIESQEEIDQRKITDLATTVNEQLVEAKEIQNDEIEIIKDPISSVIPSVNNENKIESQEEIDQRKTTDLATAVNEQLVEAKAIQNGETETIKHPISSVISSVNNEYIIESQEDKNLNKKKDEFNNEPLTLLNVNIENDEKEIQSNQQEVELNEQIPEVITEHKITETINLANMDAKDPVSDNLIESKVEINNAMHKESEQLKETSVVENANINKTNDELNNSNDIIEFQENLNNEGAELINEQVLSESLIIPSNKLLTSNDEIKYPNIATDEAAKIIQKNYRGYRVRRDLNSQKLEKNTDKHDAENILYHDNTILADASLLQFSNDFINEHIENIDKSTTDEVNAKINIIDDNTSIKEEPKLKENSIVTLSNNQNNNTTLWVLGEYVNENDSKPKNIDIKKSMLLLDSDINIIPEEDGPLTPTQLLPTTTSAPQLEQFQKLPNLETTNNTNNNNRKLLSNQSFSSTNSIDDSNDGSSSTTTDFNRFTSSEDEIKKFTGKYKSVSYELLSSSDGEMLTDIKKDDVPTTLTQNNNVYKSNDKTDQQSDNNIELSEIENFDFESYGEDSLEGMYYSLRKNELMLDRMHKRVSDQRKDDHLEFVDRKPFPERATSDLCDIRHVLNRNESQSSNNTDNEDVIIHDMSSSLNNNNRNDNVTLSSQQQLQQPIEDNSHLDFYLETDETSSDNETTLKHLNNETIANNNNNNNEEFDKFNEKPIEDMKIGNIEKKIFASSVSEADSDYYEPANINSNNNYKRLVKDDFNISTAFDHLSTDSDSTIVSAATKIQAGARGFLTRRRLRRSSGTTLSGELPSSFGNSAIDKSLDDLIEQQEHIYLDEAATKIQRSYRSHLNRKNPLKNQETIDESVVPHEMIGITEITLQQKKLGHEQVIPSKLNNNNNNNNNNTTNRQSDENEKYNNDKRVQQTENINIENVNNNAEQLSTTTTTAAVAVTTSTTKITDDANNRKIDINDANGENTHITSMNFDDLDTAQRRMTLQRGDAVQRNSTPDELDTAINLNLSLTPASTSTNDVDDNNVINNNNNNNTVDGDTDDDDNKSKINNENGDILSNNKNNNNQMMKISAANDSNIEIDLLAPSSTLSSTTVTMTHNTRSPATLSGSKNTIANERITKRKQFSLGIRQKSMPVQIDAEFIRIIPKHLRKRIKSAESIKNKHI